MPGTLLWQADDGASGSARRSSRLRPVPATEAESITEAATDADLALESLSNTLALEEERRRRKSAECPDGLAELESATVCLLIKPQVL